MLNPAFSLLVARHLAGSIMEDAELRLPFDDREDRWIYNLFRRTLGRNVSPAELVQAKSFLADHFGLLNNEARPRDDLALPIPRTNTVSDYLSAAVTGLCLALLNSNEFIYID